MSAILSLSFLVVSLSFHSLSAQTLDTSDIGAFNSGSKAVESAQPVQNSKVLKTTYPIKPGSPSAFLADEIVKLEQIASDYDSLPAAEQKSRDIKIREFVVRAVDLDRLAKRALVAYWDELSETQAGLKRRGRYVELFKKLVEENYLEKTRVYMNGKYQIPLTKETKQRKFDVVEAKILKSDVDLIVAFRLLPVGDSFKIVDVKLDETSLEASYRGSFNRIIRQKNGLAEGMPELLRVMEKRLKELQSGEATRL